MWLCFDVRSWLRVFVWLVGLVFCLLRVLFTLLLFDIVWIDVWVRDRLLFWFVCGFYLRYFLFTVC